jgi:hypothetical protein
MVNSLPLDDTTVKYHNLHVGKLKIYLNCKLKEEKLNVL